MPTYEKPELLLKSALEKIVYFEARQEQLLADSKRAKAESETLRQQLEYARKCEMESSKTLAEMQTRLRHMQAEKDQALKKVETLRKERAEWIEKILEAAQIQTPQDTPHDTFDLSQFIALLRGEVLSLKNNLNPSAPALTPSAEENSPPLSAEDFGSRFAAQGRLDVSPEEQKTLQANEKPLDNHVLEFGIRELSSQDPGLRLRTALRLKSLGRPSAAPALGQAIHAETNPEVLAALIDAFSSFAKTEGLPLVAPHADSPHPKLRLAAIKALIRMDAHAAMPQLLAALEDTDANVRRRATLWLAGLSPEESLRLGSIALEDFNPDVRAVAVYVLSISQLQAAQPKLLQALQDSNLKVRNAAAKALSQSSQTDWSSLPALEQAQRQRALRRLKYPHSTLPAVPTLPAPAPPCPPMAQPAPTPPVETPPLAPPILPQNHEALSAELLSALRSSLRGKTQEELASLIQASPQNLAASLLALELQGQVIRRGQKYFIA